MKWPRAHLMREMRPLGSISGMWKRSYGSSIETPPDERGGHCCDAPTATAPHLDFSRKRRGPQAAFRRRSKSAHSSGVRFEFCHLVFFHVTSRTPQQGGLPLTTHTQPSVERNQGAN